MNDQDLAQAGESPDVTIVIRRTIYAPVDKVFAAWTQPVHLKRWWGPPPVTCVDAQFDLQAGGSYRIANQFPDGKLLWITGEFEVVDPPYKLVYSWRAGSESHHSERVTVQFKPRGDATEVIVAHERILNSATRDQHELGWKGCLGGLAEYMSRDARKA